MSKDKDSSAVPTDAQPQPDSGHDEFNDARWWLSDEEAEAAEIRSMEIGKALAATLIPRPKVIDLNDEELDSWKIGQGLAGTVKPRPKL